ncbi:hypothetical protein [Nocardia araoensis]|uniref:hypothetical protein n=1 Tax=Nocardia araoensis TaxID=228600 RepID=UPI0014614392|nr:hypothetical protein [Nocardia araoensis]
MSGYIPSNRGWRLSGYLLDVVGGSVVASGAVQQRHGGQVLLDVRGQTSGREDLSYQVSWGMSVPRIGRCSPRVYSAARPSMSRRAGPVNS